MTVSKPIGGRLRRQVHVALVGTSLAAVVPGAMAATITVDSAADMSGAGQCTLRDAIAAANQNEMVAGCTAGDDMNDTIVFGNNVAGSTITLGGTALPTIVIVAGIMIVMTDRNRVLR